MKKNSFSKERRAFLRASASAGTAALLVTPATASSGNPTLVALENARQGSYDWYLNRMARNSEILGYASATSINRGESINIHVHCVEPNYSLEVYRLGWYNGVGARLMKSPVMVSGTRQPMPTPDPVTGMVECNWTNPYNLTTGTSATDPTVWPSGYYLVKLTSQPSGYQAYVVFVLRDDARTADLLFQQSITTYAAYNMWGGKNLYGGAGGRAYKVSLNRPFDDAAGAGGTFTLEVQMIRFLEREGYDVKYCTNVDTHTTLAKDWRAKAFLSVGHDEYWSWEMRSNVEQARDRGINLGFFSANTCFRQIRFEPSPVTRAANCTIVCYKDNLLDPYFNDPKLRNLTTTYWRGAPVNRPEAALIGIQYAENMFPASGDIVVANKSHWAFSDANLNASNTRFIGLLNGREVDSIQSGSPSNIEVLCASQVRINGLPDDPNRISQVTIYTWPGSGAQVFAAGTMTWTWALDSFGSSWRYNVPVNLEAQQLTRNILKRFTSNQFG